ITSVTFQWSRAGVGKWTTIGTDGTAPYVVALDTSSLPDGLYDLRATTIDSAGATATSPTIDDRVVSNGTTSALLSDPAMLLHGTVGLSATITSDFPILQVAFQRLAAGPSRVWTTIATSTTEPFDAGFDTTSVTDGLYSLRVVATDEDGATIYSPPLVG